MAKFNPLNPQKGQEAKWWNGREIIDRSAPVDQKNCILHNGFKETYPDARDVKVRHGIITAKFPKINKKVRLTLFPGCAFNYKKFDEIYRKVLKVLGDTEATNRAREKTKPHWGAAIVTYVGPIPTAAQKAKKAEQSRKWHKEHPDYQQERSGLRGRAF